jgi:hypothetical protein
MPQNTWTGLLGHVGRPDTNNRELELLHVDDVPLPLLYSEPGADYYDARIVGSIQTVGISDGDVHGNGYTDLAPGDYAVDLDLGAVQPGRRAGTLRGTLVAATATTTAGSGAGTITVVAA